LPTPDAAPAAAALDAIFGALADPVRRTLVEELAAEPHRTPTSLSAGLPITRQAVTKHLAALSAAGIVNGTRSGREIRYEVTPERLTAALDWITAVGADWDDRLARLAHTIAHRYPG
jgi:DNA-binding transcriptional ArsR family regulator